MAYSLRGSEGFLFSHQAPSYGLLIQKLWRVSHRKLATVGQWARAGQGWVYDTVTGTGKWYSQDG